MTHKGYESKQSWHNLRCYPVFDRRNWERKTKKDYRKSLGRDSKPGASEYKVNVITRSRYSVQKYPASGSNDTSDNYPPAANCLALLGSQICSCVHCFCPLSYVMTVLFSKKTETVSEVKRSGLGNTALALIVSFYHLIETNLLLLRDQRNIRSLYKSYCTPSTNYVEMLSVVLYGPALSWRNKEQAAVGQSLAARRDCFLLR
jgi:hypothetical protein